MSRSKEVKNVLENRQYSCLFYSFVFLFIDRMTGILLVLLSEYVDIKTDVGLGPLSLWACSAAGLVLIAGAPRSAWASVQTPWEHVLGGNASERRVHSQLCLKLQLLSLLVAHPHPDLV